MKRTKHKGPYEQRAHGSLAETGAIIPYRRAHLGAVLLNGYQAIAGYVSRGNRQARVRRPEYALTVPVMDNGIGAYLQRFHIARCGMNMGGTTEAQPFVP